MVALTYFYTILSIILGACFGSFLNVIIYRLPRKQSIVFPASHCPQCETKIRPYHNIPILSYIFLGGKCRYCGCDIPFRYFFVEILTAFCFFILLFFNGFVVDISLLRDVVFFLFGIAIIFIDIGHFIIPDVLSIPLFFIGVVFAFLCSEPVWWSALLGGAIGFLFFYGIAWIYFSVKKEMGLGGGDIKYIAAIGVFVGLSGLLFVLFASAFIALLTFCVFSFSKNMIVNKHTENTDLPQNKAFLPFAPFLTVATFLFILFGEKLITGYLTLFQ